MENYMIKVVPPADARGGIRPDARVAPAWRPLARRSGLARPRLSAGTPCPLGLRDAGLSHPSPPAGYGGILFALPPARRENC